MYSDFSECCSHPELAARFGCNGHRADHTVWDEEINGHILKYHQCPIQWIPNNIDGFIELIEYHRKYHVPMPQYDRLPERMKLALRYYETSLVRAARVKREIEDLKFKG